MKLLHDIFINYFKCNKKSSIVQFVRHGPPARDGISSLHSDGEALPEVACLSCVASNDRDTPVTPAELGDKLLALHPPGF